MIGPAIKPHLNIIDIMSVIVLLILIVYCGGPTTVYTVKLINIYL